MDSQPRHLLESLRHTAVGSAQAAAGVRRTTEAALHATMPQREDIRDTLHRVEALITNLAAEIRGQRGNAPTGAGC